MSGKREPASQKTVAQNAGASRAANSREASARWAALDSRHERLVTASDAVLAELLVNHKNDRRRAS